MKLDISRKEFINTIGLGTLFALPTQLLKWFPNLAVFSPGKSEAADKIILVVFQRGGMDGLNAVVPHGDEDYYIQRPALSIPEPNSNDGTGIDLDGFFSLHPSLLPFKDLWDDQALAIVHACGSPDPTHSHFDAMDYMERGTPGEKNLSTGWLARHFETMSSENDSPFRLVGIGSMLQSSLRGSVAATNLKSIVDFHLGGRRNAGELTQFQNTLASLYGFGSDLDDDADITLQATETLSDIVNQTYTPAFGSSYPETQFGQGLLQIAQMIKSDIGLEAAAIDIGGWDTHANQGQVEGELPGLLGDLSSSLSAFYADMGDYANKIVIVTMTEFGRRVKENGSGGTDHGHGSVMFVLGGNIDGGKVYGQWPGLAKDQLYGPGDLDITTDYRDVLAEILEGHLMNGSLGQVFPGYDKASPLGLLRE